MTDAYALKLVSLPALMDWHAKVMNENDRPKTLVEQDIDELDREFAS